MDYQNRYRETLNRKAEFGTPSEATKDSDSNLGEIEKELADFKTCVDSVGTPLNTDHNRSEVRRLRSVIKRRLGDAKTSVQGQRGVEAQQLSKQINNYAHRFEAMMNQEKELTQQSSGSVVVESPDGSELPMIHYQEQATISDVRERERDAAELVELEKDILDLHAIQKDLGEMVNEQGEITHHIETNVTQAAGRVTHAKHKLEDAVALKSRKRKLMCAIALAIGVPVAIIVLVIIIILAAVLSQNN